MADRARKQLIGRVIAGAIGIAALVIVWLLISGILFSNWIVGTVSALVMVGALYWFLTQKPRPRRTNSACSRCAS